MMLSGCTAYSDVATLGPTIAALNEMPAETASSYIANQTVMTFDPPKPVCLPYGFGTTIYYNCYTQPGHGTQIEYFHPDGIAVLWYPGNRRPVPSRWKLEKSTSSHRICFQYPSRSKNALTGDAGGKWECIGLGFWAKDIVEKRPGDIFSLLSGSIPSRLGKEATTFDALLK